MASARLPLQGIRVYEFGGNVAGPYATWILAELGAEVIKIERPEGDDARGWGPPFWNGAATTFQAINRNKKSVSLDLQDNSTLDNLRSRVASEADIVVQNLRPNAAAKLGLGADDLRKINPRLIYCNLHAFGSVGPMKDRPGYDVLMQAFGGIISITGEEGQPPVRAGVSVVDMGAGMWCVIGILTALLQRNLTGEGSVVDTSLFETTLGWMSLASAQYMITRKRPDKRGTGARGIVPYQAYPCADGHLIIAASNDRLFVKFAKAIGHPEWSEDTRFNSNRNRVENRGALNPMIEELLLKEKREHWQKLLDDAGVPNSPIQSIDEVITHPQTEALGMFQPTDDPNMQILGLPLSMNGERPQMRSVAPALGADTEEWKKQG